MEWVIVGLVAVSLIMWRVWRYLWARSEPPGRHEMTDVRGALADRLQQLASEAREEGRHHGAQRLAFQARWLRTRPDVGGDEPPDVLLPTNERHVRFAGAVWDRYRSFLDEERDPGKPRLESDLPYPKDGIAAALKLLLDIGERRVSCEFIDARSIQSDALEAMKRALSELDEYEDVPE